MAAGCQDDRADREGCKSREKVPVQVGGYKKKGRASRGGVRAGFMNQSAADEDD